MENPQQLPEKHNLSGVYFRFLNPLTGKYENRVFEDLPDETMREKLENRNEEWLKEMVVLLAKCLNTIAEEFQISAENVDSDL